MISSKNKIISVLLVFSFLTVFIFQTNIIDTAGSTNRTNYGSEIRTYIISMDRDAPDWIRISDRNAINLVNQLLEEGVPVSWALEEFTVGNRIYPAGTFYIEAPFTTRKGISSDEVMSWFSWKGKTDRIYRITETTEEIDAESKELVMPRIALFYDHTTYTNALKTYNRLREYGFKVFFVNAVDLLADPWDDPGTAFDKANVFLMPGGAMHLHQFPTEEDQEKGIRNIQQFIDAGGGYIGICAGATEALKGSPWLSLDLVDGAYYDEWFIDDWDWRQLIGPMNVEITNENHPVMFGFGPDAVRPGYGPETPIYYYGGPAMHSLGEGTEVLAEFSSPTTQMTPERVEDIWGSAAIVSEDYGDGRTVLFSPHPELVGPAGRLLAQASYYVAAKERPYWQEPDLSQDLPEDISSERVANITESVNDIKPYLEDTARLASEMVNLEAGDHYHSLGIWYDKDLRDHANAIYEKLKLIDRYAIKFEYEYQKLNIMKKMVEDDPQLLEIVEYSQAMIDEFFALTEEFSPEPHTIWETDWTGAGPFDPFDDYEPTTFTDFPEVFRFINEEVNEIVLPFVENYAELFHEYEELRRNYETDPSPELEEELEEKEAEITGWDPPGALWEGMSTLRHTLDIMQYKINYHLLSQITHADRVREVLSMNNHILADSFGQFSYTSVQVRSLIVNPGGFLKFEDIFPIPSDIRTPFDPGGFLE